MQLTDDDFSLFGLERRYRLDPSVLEQRWRALQAEVHPDRHADQGPAAQRVAAQWSVRVNEAFRRLRDPLARAGYLCTLAGIPLEAERNTAMPAAFLMQQMAWREALEAARTREAAQALLGEVRAAVEQGLATVARQLDDEADPVGAAQTVRALMFTQRFLRDVSDRIEAFEHG